MTMDPSAPIDAECTAGKITTTIRQPIEQDGLILQVGCSIGLSSYPNPAPDARALFEQADAAMYAVKRDGKNGCRRFA